MCLNVLGYLSNTGDKETIRKAFLKNKKSLEDVFGE
jgi:hypothetical protein